MPVWIRPLGAHGNSQDGTSYDTAYLGLKHASIPWTDGTQDLYICGTHLPPTFTTGDPNALYAVSSIAGGASPQRKRIIRGDMVPSDPGVIHCGMFQEHAAWTDETGGVWSQTLSTSPARAWGGGSGNSAPATAVYEYNGNDYTWLTYARSLAECQSTAGSTFVAATGTQRVLVADSSSFTVSETATGGTSGASGTISAKGAGYLDLTSWNQIAFTQSESITSPGGSSTVSAANQYIQGNGQNGDTWYVHTNDGLTPSGRVCRPGWGWNLMTSANKNIIWHRLKFVGAQGWNSGAGTGGTPYHDGFELRRCIFDGFNSYALLVLNNLHRDIVVDRCEFAWGENGIYHLLNSVPGDNLVNARITRNYFHDLGRKERSTITSDNHAFGLQGADGVLLEGNVVDGTGNALVCWAGASSYTAASMKNIAYRRNVVRDLHDEGNFQFRFGMDVTDQNPPGTSTGIDASGNVMEYNYIDLPTDKTGMGGSICGSGIVANIPTIRYNTFIGGKFAQSSSRYANYQNNMAIGPVDFFVSNGPGETAIVTFENNTYSGTPTVDFQHGGVNKTEAEWNALGFDV